MSRPSLPEGGHERGPGSFAHASEAEFARILDFYEVRWRYEPDVFPILWDLDGNVVESFAPDFFLPDMDLYVELTTLQQRLVRKKNRKVRRLRELYPSITIKLFYARDFRALMLKYGRARLIDELSGTGGQVGVRHPRVTAAAAVEILGRSSQGGTIELTEARAVDAPTGGSMERQDAGPEAPDRLPAARSVQTGGRGIELQRPALSLPVAIGRSRAARRRAARRNHNPAPTPLES